MIRNIILNISGVGLPLLIGLLTIPIIIDGLGLERFSLLSISWVIVGYFSIFDLGLGRALTQSIARLIGENRINLIWSTFTKTLYAMVLLSAFGALALLAATSSIVQLINVPPSLKADAFNTFYWLSVGVPAVVLFNGFRGSLEAAEQFLAVSVARSALGCWMFIAPLVILPFTTDVSAIVAILVLGRYVLTLWTGVVATRSMRRIVVGTPSDSAPLNDIARVGGWMTVSNIVSPLMTYIDRFFVASSLGIAVVAYYTTAYDLISRLSFIPEAAFTVLFSRMSKLYGVNGAGASNFLDLVSSCVNFLTFAFSLGVIAVSPDFMALWISPEFSRVSSPILSILAVGFFVNTAARPYYNALQASGRADVTAKLHLIELPLYLAVLTYCVSSFGIAGAAFAWVARATLDFALLAYVKTTVDGEQDRVLRRVGAVVVAVGVLLAVAQVDSGLWRYLICGTLMIVQIALWKRIFAPEHQILVSSSLDTLKNKALTKFKFPARGGPNL